MQPLEHLQAHDLRVLSQGKHLVIRHGGGIQQCVRAAEIVGIAIRYRRQRLTVGRSNVGVLSVIPKDVGHVLAGLQVIAAAGQVIHPVPGVFRPGLVATEPLAEDEEPQARTVIVGRLVGALVDEEAVEAAEEGDVGHFFQIAGIPAVGASQHAICGEALAGHQVLSVEVGGRCRFADIRLVGNAFRCVYRPDGRHRHAGAALGIHAVAHEGAGVLVTFRIATLHAVFAQDIVHAVVIGGKQLADGLPPVEEEGLGGVGGVDDFAREGGQPRPQGIAPGVLEGRFHSGSPGHLLGLVAVDHQILDAPFAQQAVGGVFIQIQVGVEIAVPGVRVQFVHFQPGGLRRSGVVLLSRQGSAEAVDAPFAGRRVPGEDAVLHLIGEVNGLRHSGICCRRGQCQQVSGRGEAGLLLGVVYLVYRVQFPLMDGGAGGDYQRRTVIDQAVVRHRIQHRQPEESGGGFGDVHGDLCQVGRRHTHHFRPGVAVQAAQERIVVGPFGIELSLDLPAHQGHGADGHRFRESVLDPGVRAFFVEGQLAAVVEVSVGELLDGEVSAAGADRGPQFQHALFCFWYAYGHDGHVGIPLGHLLKHGSVHAGTHVLEAADVLVRLGERERLALPVSFHLHRAPGEFFHAVFRGDPGTSGAAPTRCGGDADLHAQRIGQGNGIGEILFPCVAQVRRLGDDGRQALHHGAAGVKLVETGDANPVHPFQILADAVFGSVSVDPMPPDIGAGLAGRICKTVLIFRVGAVLDAVGHDLAPEGIEGSGFPGAGDFSPDRLRYLLEYGRSGIAAFLHAGGGDAEGRSHGAVGGIEFSHDAAHLGDIHIIHCNGHGGGTVFDAAIAFAAHQAAHVDLLGGRVPAQVDAAPGRAVVHIGGRCLQSADKGLVFICLRLAEADADVEIGGAIAGVVVGFAGVCADIELSAAIPGDLNVHGAAHEVVLQRASPDAAAKAGEAVEGCFRVGRLRLNLRAGDPAVADGRYALVLLDDAHKRSDIRTLRREDQAAVFHVQIQDLAVGHRPEETGLVAAQFRNPKAFDGMPLAVEDAFEGVAPPFGGSEFIICFVTADGLPVGDAGQVQIVLQNVPTVEVLPDGFQIFYRADGLG